MMNRRGFLNKFLKGAAATAVVAPVLLLKPRPEEILHTEEELLEEANRYVHNGPYHEDHIINIDPSDTPFINGVPRKDAHEWLTDELREPGTTQIFRKDIMVSEGQRAVHPDAFQAEVEYAQRKIAADIERKIWIDQPSFSREAMEAACGQNPSFFPEGSRERITALGAEAMKRSAEAQTAYKESFDYGGWMDGTAKKCGSSPA